MSHPALARLAAAGITLRADGDHLDVEYLEPLTDQQWDWLAAHKDELLLALSSPAPALEVSPQALEVSAHRLWIIRQLDGSTWSSSFTPALTRAEVEDRYPDCVVEPEPDQLPINGPSTTTPEAQAIGEALLAHWGETDPQTCEEYLAGLADPRLLEQARQALGRINNTLLEAIEERAAILEHEAGIPREEAEVLAACCRCRHWSPDTINPHGGLGRCGITAPASQRPGSLWPWHHALIRCTGFGPKEEPTP